MRIPNRARVGTHPGEPASSAGLRRRARGGCLALVGALVLGLVVPPVVEPSAVEAAQPAAGVYSPVTPYRVLDTREGATPPDRGTVRVRVAGSGAVPSGATAVVVNLTITNTTRAGFVSAWPAGRPRPLASVLNAEGPGETIANLVTVPVGPDGAIALYTQHRADLVVDVQGFYTPSGNAAAGRFAASTPTRVLDTRTGAGAFGVRERRTIDLTGFAGITARSRAAALKVTVAGATEPGYWTVLPAGAAVPEASNLNVGRAGQVVANQVVVGLSDGRLTVFSQRGGHLVVDVVGSFTGDDATASGAGRFVPVDPARLVDTRTIRAPGRSATIEVRPQGRAGVPGGGVSAVVINATTTETAAPGYVAVWSSRTYRPLSSSLNATGRGQTIANHVITPVSPAGFAMFTQSGGHLIADVTGYFTGPAQQAGLPPPVPLPDPAGPGPASDYVFALVHQPGGGWRADSATGDPVRWDACRPIRYVVNHDGARARYEPIVREALDRLSMATGLTFVSKGTTSFMPRSGSLHDQSPGQGFDRSGNHELIIAFGTAADTDQVEGTSLGRANYSWIVPPDGIAEYVLGSVVIDTADTGTEADWAPGGAGPVLLHELGHIVGLSHAGETQLMSSVVGSGTPRSYAAGDRAGLWRVGGWRGCVDNPSLATAERLPVPAHWASAE